MSTRKDAGQEDIASLFAAFGGEVSRYQEFGEAAGTEQRPGWPLLQSLAGEADAASAAAGAAVPPSADRPVPAVPPAAAPVRSAPMPVFAPDAAAGPTALFSGARAAPAAAEAPAVPRGAAIASAATSEAAGSGTARSSSARPAPPAAGTPLSVLFERLSASPAGEAEASRHSLMAHWRQSG